MNETERYFVTANRRGMLPPCPEVSDEMAEECRGFLSPVKDLVIWHHEGNDLDLRDRIKVFEKLLAQPKNVMWWVDRDTPRLCLGHGNYSREY
jgi:hypothetical protein